MQKCYVCLRITPKYVLIQAHKLYKDRKIAREQFKRVYSIIEEVYSKKPYYFCGKSRKAVVSSLLYLLGLQRKKIILTQLKVSHLLSVSEPTIRTNSRRWLSVFPSYFPIKPNMVGRIKGGKGIREKILSIIKEKPSSAREINEKLKISDKRIYYYLNCLYIEKEIISLNKGGIHFHSINQNRRNENG